MANGGVIDVKCHPRQPGVLILISEDKIKVINLLKKRKMLVYHNNSEERVNNRGSSFYSTNGDSLALTQSNKHLVIFSLTRRGTTHETEVTSDEMYTADAVTVTDDLRFICVSISCIINKVTQS